MECRLTDGIHTSGRLRAGRVCRLPGEGAVETREDGMAVVIMLLATAPGWWWWWWMDDGDARTGGCSQVRRPFPREERAVTIRRGAGASQSAGGSSRLGAQVWGESAKVRGTQILSMQRWSAEDGESAHRAQDARQRPQNNRLKPHS